MAPHQKNAALRPNASCLGCWVGENALTLGELLAHIGHQTTSVAQGELVGHVVIDEVVVTFNLSNDPFSHGFSLLITY